MSSFLTTTARSVLQTSINPHVYFVPDDVALELYFRKDDEFNQDYWFNEPYLRIGGVITAVVISLAFALVLLASWFKARRKVKIDKAKPIDKNEKRF